MRQNQVQSSSPLHSVRLRRGWCKHRKFQGWCSLHGDFGRSRPILSILPLVRCANPVVSVTIRKPVSSGKYLPTSIWKPLHRPAGMWVASTTVPGRIADGALTPLHVPPIWPVALILLSNGSGRQFSMAAPVCGMVTSLATPGTRSVESFSRLGMAAAGSTMGTLCSKSRRSEGCSVHPV